MEDNDLLLTDDELWLSFSIDERFIYDKVIHALHDRQWDYVPKPLWGFKKRFDTEPVEVVARDLYRAIKALKPEEKICYG